MTSKAENNLLAFNDRSTGTEELQSVNAQKAATLLGVGLRTVRRLLSDGKLASYRVGRCVRIRLEDLRAYQKQNMQGGCV
jgi:putative molybdopterin biosynthesis protein